MKMTFPSFQVFSGKPAYQPSRRVAPRVQSLNLLKCLRSDDMPLEMIANFVNLSETGLQFMSPRVIKPGSLLKMVINLGEQDRQMTVTGRTAWQGRIRGSKDVYRTGVVFLSMADEDRQAIRWFVKNIFISPSL